MRGHVHKRQHRRKDGSVSVLWYAVTDVPGGDKRKQHWSRGFKTRREAEQELSQVLAGVMAGTFVTRNPLTTQQYLLETWLPLIALAVKATTLAGYQQVLRDYVLPHIGRVRLQDLSVSHLNNLYLHLLERGGKGQNKSGAGRSPRPLSPKTVSNVHALLSKALNDAVAQGLISLNPATKAQKIKGSKKGREIQAWSALELNHFLASLEDNLFGRALRVLAFTGLRRSEVLGLRWEDVNVSAATIAVRQTVVVVGGRPQLDTPKSHEARVVDIDDDTLAVLRRQRKAQMQERLAFSGVYISSGRLFTRVDGSMIHPDGLSQAFDRLVRSSRLRRISLHGLRHTHATILLEQGVPVKVVSERLGHSDPAFTIRTYQHVLQGMQRSAATTFSAAVTHAVDTRTGGSSV